MSLPISKETFRNADERDYRDAQWDMFDYMDTKWEQQVEKCDKRFCRIEKRNFIEKAALAITGAVIAFFAWFNK